MKADDAPVSHDPVDGVIRFYLTWNGHRYRFGRVDGVRPRKVRLARPELFASDPSRLPPPVPPVLSTAFEVTTTPYEYRRQSDPDDAPMRQGMNVLARQLKPGDYIVVSDEEFKMIVDKPEEEA